MGLLLLTDKNIFLIAILNCIKFEKKSSSVDASTSFDILWGAVLVERNLFQSKWPLWCLSTISLGESQGRDLTPFFFGDLRQSEKLSKITFNKTTTEHSMAMGNLNKSKETMPMTTTKLKVAL